MEALATSKHIRISARKARQVANLIRGKSVDEAVSILALTPKKASPILKKIVLSAAANVKFKNDGEVAMDNNTIVVKEIRIDEGPTMKRIRPRAQGRAFRILKRTSHIKVVVEA
ncbi:MAG: 50S ribosomal protein L22 [Candidatus Krumholzibacteria bacterium]|nr:50S ribosomal protein L22 [Candidatus Krumholzibacteria bacterium]